MSARSEQISVFLARIGLPNNPAGDWQDFCQFVNDGEAEKLFDAITIEASLDTTSVGESLVLEVRLDATALRRAAKEEAAWWVAPRCEECGMRVDECICAE